MAENIGTDGMPDYVSRMVVEYTELVRRLNALNAEITRRMALEDGDDASSDDDQGWMVAQSYAMALYAHALWQRAHIAGYDLSAISLEAHDDEPGTGTDS